MQDPAPPVAEYMGDAVCAACHGDLLDDYGQTLLSGNYDLEFRLARLRHGSKFLREVSGDDALQRRPGLREALERRADISDRESEVPARLGCHGLAPGFGSGQHDGGSDQLSGPDIAHVATVDAEHDLSFEQHENLGDLLVRSIQHVAGLSLAPVSEGH